MARSFERGNKISDRRNDKVLLEALRDSHLVNEDYVSRI